jgi:energy-coupling factor transporter transmembrane protein EcfT
MNCALAFLLTALVFSLSYFSTVLVRSSKGLMVAAGALLAFSVIKFAVLLAWPWINFPALSPLQFTQLEQGVVTGFAPHLGISVAIRVAIILLFPIGALFLLQKRDIE